MKKLIFFFVSLFIIESNGYCHKEWLFQLEESSVLDVLTSCQAQRPTHLNPGRQLKFDISFDEKSLEESFRELFPITYYKFTKRMGRRSVEKQEKIDPVTDGEKQQFPLLQKLYEPQEKEKPHPINSTNTLAEQVLWAVTQTDLYTTIASFLEDLGTPTSLYLEESKKEIIRRIPVEKWEKSIFSEICREAKISQLNWQHQSQLLAEEWRKDVSMKNPTFKKAVEEIFCLYNRLEDKNKFSLDLLFVNSIDELHNLRYQGETTYKIRKSSGKYYNSLLDTPERTLYAYHKYILYALKEVLVSVKMEKQELGIKKEKWLNRAQRDAEYWRAALLGTEHEAIYSCLCGLRVSFNKWAGYHLRMGGFFED